MLLRIQTLWNLGQGLGDVRGKKGDHGKTFTPVAFCAVKKTKQLVDAVNI